MLGVSTLVHGSESSPADPPLRAALVSFAEEGDLSNLLFSIRQLEEKFNTRYQYDWIIFSPSELSETFKTLTSNASGATCLFEVIPDENWNAAGLAVDPDTRIMDLRRRHRWNSGAFAHEERLSDYDWFWRVEPGVSAESSGLLR